MRNKYLSIICFLYSFIIGYVWFTKGLNNFLAPQMQIYIKITFFILITMGIIMLFIKGKSTIRFSELILLIPLLILLATGDGKMGASLANNRNTNHNNENRIKINQEELDKKKKEMESREVEIISYDFKNTYFDVKDKTYDDLANYMLYEKAIKYEGKTIRVKGLAVKYAKYLSDGYFALGKYVISCCAADANFSGFIVKLDDHTIIHNKWYEIEGVLEPAVDADGYQVMAIKIINLKELDSKKENQYVYPCYAYDDGLCSATKKYNLEY